MAPLPSPPPHILAMGDDILRELDVQQQKMDELFLDGWPESIKASERTNRQPRRSRTPGDVNPPSHQSTSVLFDNPSKIPAGHSPPTKLNFSPGGGLAVNSNPILQRSPMPNLSPGGLAVNSTPTLRRSPCVDEKKSKYEKMMSQHHKAIIQIKQEKKKPSYPSSIVPKVRSAECNPPLPFFSTNISYHCHVNPHSIKNMQVFRISSRTRILPTCNTTASINGAACHSVKQSSVSCFPQAHSWRIIQLCQAPTRVIVAFLMVGIC